VTSKDYQVTVPAAGATYTYDLNGNLTSKTEGSDVWAYEWNAEGQLKRVLVNGSEVARFAYDPIGRRVEKIAGGVTTSYLYDGEDILREIRGAATFKYVHGSGIDEPLAREEGAGTLTYYHADGLGSIVKRTSQAGAVVHEYRYDVWGNIEVGATEPGYAFTGREWDPETGLCYYRARLYRPPLGRFISEDPVGMTDRSTRYGYALDNPVMGVDPTGLRTHVLFPQGHAAVRVDNNGEPLLYDPAGSYIPKGMPHHIDILSDQDADLAPYIRYHETIDRQATHVYTFETCPNDEAAIAARILEQPTVVTGGLCATQVQAVIAGIGPFKDIPAPGFFCTTPGALEKMVIKAAAGN
jgi:RHS repeat-associated protein